MRFTALTTAVIVLTGCATDSRQSATDAPPESYLKIERPTESTVELQVAARRFKAQTRRGADVWLVGASHIGDSNYFARLQKLLEPHRVVLFEGVGAGSRVKRFDPAEAPSIQHTMATSLGMVFQLSAIDYDRPNFRNSDLTLARMQQLLMNSTNTNGGSEEFQQLLQVMDGSSMLGTLLHVGLKFLGSSPKLQALTKLVLIEILGRIEGDMSQLKGLPPEMERLLQVIIQERNKVVTEDLSSELKRGPQPGSIAVFYGAGHMVDLEKRLRNELRYRPRETVWLTAMSVDTRAAGLSAAELEMMREMVRWQMEALGQAGD